MTQIGGDSQNTMPVAIQAGLQARQIAKASIDPAAKFTMDGFKQSFSNPGQILQNTKANLPIADALQQQSFLTRLAARIPFVRNFLGPDFIVNEAIGKLGKDALNGVSKASITKAVLEGGDDAAAIAVKLRGLNVGDDAIKAITESIGKKVAAQGGRAVASEVATTAGQSVARTVVNSAGDDLARQLVGVTLKGGKTVSEEAIKAAVNSPNARAGLIKLGFYARDLDKVGIIKGFTSKAAETAGKSAATEVAATAASTAAKETSKGGFKGFLGKVFGGAKGNFVVAGIFSLASNAIQLAQGKMSIPQFVGLTVLDTAAYGAIGWGSAAAGAAIGTMVGGPIGTVVGFLGGLALGFLGGTVYEKTVRNPVKSMLGGTPAGGADPSQYDPGAYNPNAPAANQPYAPLPPSAGTQMDYDQAMREIERLAAGNR